MQQVKRNRFIKISRNLLEGLKFDSVEEFRALFYLKVEADVFKGENERFKSKVFMQEFKLFVFKSHKKISSNKFNSLLLGLHKKGVSKQILEKDDSNFIVIHDYEVEKIRGVNQIYALFISKWAKGNSNIYFKKDVFYTWFDCDTTDRAMVFKRAMKGIGLPNANYKVEGNKLTIFRNIPPVVQQVPIVSTLNPMMKTLEDLCNESYQEMMDDVNYGFEDRF